MKDILTVGLIGSAIGGIFIFGGIRYSQLNNFIGNKYPEATIVGYDWWSATDGCTINSRFVYQGKQYLGCGEVMNSNFFVKERG